jgi:hypothetical protein
MLRGRARARIHQDYASGLSAQRSASVGGGAVSVPCVSGRGRGVAVVVVGETREARVKVNEPLVLALGIRR